MRFFEGNWPIRTFGAAFVGDLKRTLSVLFCACLLAVWGRLALFATYSYALEAHSAGEYSKALPIVFGNAMFQDSGACGLLGTMYLFGQGVQINGSSAEYWLLKAATNGSVSSQSVLGTMYATGKGVRRDPGKAQIWFSKAAASGDVAAGFALRKLHRSTAL